MNLVTKLPYLQEFEFFLAFLLVCKIWAPNPTINVTALNLIIMFLNEVQFL